MSYIKQKRKVSVAMAIFNCATTLREAVDSIINQTYTDWELILCDDCSTDDTLAIANEYANNHDNILVIRNEHNLGLPASLNHCIEYAQGEYIARMDGDDISLPERFQVEVDFLDSHPEYAIVSCAMINFDENGDWGIQRKPEKPEKIDFVHGSPICHAPCIMRKAALADVGNYTVRENLRRGQDYFLWHKFYCKGYKGYNIQEPYYKMRDDLNADYRKGTKTSFKKRFKSRMAGANTYREIIKDLGLSKWYYVYAMHDFIIALMPNSFYMMLHKRKIGK